MESDLDITSPITGYSCMVRDLQSLNKHRNRALSYVAVMITGMSGGSQPHSDGPGTGDDNACAVAVDGSNNAIDPESGPWLFPVGVGEQHPLPHAHTSIAPP